MAVDGMTALALDHVLEQGLFGRLRRDCGADWAAYVHHPFVQALGDGSLPQAAFRAFLIQDYLFLIQYARAYMLAAYKHDDPADMRAALDTAVFLLDSELKLHVAFCADWGISEAAMAAAPQTLQLLAYTRFVLDCGMAGDVLDLLTALAPCIAGYAEIAARFAARPAGNPYAAWIASYTGAEYRQSVQHSLMLLDRIGAARGAAVRYDSLLAIFRTAARLEAAFWDTGWHAVAPAV